MKKSLSKRLKTVLILLAVILVSTLVLAPRVWSDGPEKRAAPGKTSARAFIPVDAYVVKATTLVDQLQTTGTVQANQEVDLVSEVARKVTAIAAKEGTFVRSGALLFKLDDADLLARKKRLLLQEKLALLDEKRFRELLATESVNQQEYDQVSTNLKVLQADIGVLNVELAKTEIRAPFAGKIGLNQVDVGAYVTPATVLTSLEDISRVEISFSVPEQYAVRMQAGQKISFTTESGPETHTAKVVATAPETDLNTRSLLVKAVSDNPERRLVPGSSAKIQFSLSATANGIVIPSQGLIPTPKGHQVFLIRRGQVEARDVSIGSRREETVQVVEGLTPGDTIVTTNILKLATGVPVKVVTMQQGR